MWAAVLRQATVQLEQRPRPARPVQGLVPTVRGRGRGRGRAAALPALAVSEPFEASSEKKGDDASWVTDTSCDGDSDSEIDGDGGSSSEASGGWAGAAPVLRSRLAGGRRPCRAGWLYWTVIDRLLHSLSEQGERSTLPPKPASSSFTKKALANA